MLTPFGKALRILRLDRGELLKDMADRLGVSAAYLSSVENGKKSPTSELMNRISTHYELTNSEWEDLKDAKAKTIRMIEIGLARPEDEEVGLLFARKLSGLSANQRDKILEILKTK